MAPRSIAPPSNPVFRRPSFLWQLKQTTISLGQRTQIMGIVNITPDSFSQDGLLHLAGSDPSTHLRYALKLIRQGADIIDIGGESSRPGAKPVSTRTELRRILPVIKLLTKKTKIPISVDTYKPLVAKHALDAGASVVNLIQGTRISQSMINLIRSTGAGVVLMHMRKTPITMQTQIHYTNLIPEIIAELKKSVQKCLDSGINSDRIIIDPGIGFSKTVQHNLHILKHLHAFSVLQLPILIGTSRKSFIGHILNRPDPSQRVWGTAATISQAILQGAHIVRVHDVAPMRDVADALDALLSSQEKGTL